MDGYAPAQERKQEQNWMETNSEKELILLEGKNGNYEQMYNNRWLKNFDILKEGTSVAKMHVTSILILLSAWKSLIQIEILWLNCWWNRRKRVYLFNC